MAQLNITLDYEFFIGLFSESKEEAFAKLMKSILDQTLLAESKEQLGADLYERNTGRTDYRNGTRTKPLTTRIGKIELEVPRHRNVPFTTVLFENYQRTEQALITTMMETEVQGVSTRNVQKVTEELCGEKFSKSTVSELCKNLDEPVRNFKNRLLTERYPFVMLDAMYIKVREDHKIVSKAVMIALGFNTEGKKEIIGFDIFEKESEPNWARFLNNLKDRGLRGVDIVISDNHKGLVKAVKENLPGVSWQRCQVHFTRNIIDKTPKKHQAGLATELREILNCSTITEARKIRDRVVNDYQDVAEEAIKTLDEGFEDVMVIMALPAKYRISLRSTNILERENREIRRREKVIQIFPNIESAIRLIGAVLMDDHNDWIYSHKCFDMKEYFDKEIEIKKRVVA
jgi:transposase-like protein